jgi:hypothetical protein
MSQVAEKSTDPATDASWLNKLPIFAGVLALLLVVVYAFTFRKLPAGENPAAWGTFGDYMGGLLNPLISLFTLIVAMKVWGLQKTELLETRKAVEEQGKTAEQQRREQRFFDLLSLYRETVNSIEYSSTYTLGRDRNIQTSSGKQALTSILGSVGLRSITEDSHGDSPMQSNDNDVAKMTRHIGTYLNHYFRVVFTLLREAEPVLGDEHFRYVKLFRAQLSRNELTLIALNLLYDAEGAKLQPLVSRYGLLKHLHDCPLRRWAEQRLAPASFGRRYAQACKKVLGEIHAD